MCASNSRDLLGGTHPTVPRGFVIASDEQFTSFWNAGRRAGIGERNDSSAGADRPARSDPGWSTEPPESGGIEIAERSFLRDRSAAASPAVREGSRIIAVPQGGKALVSAKPLDPGGRGSSNRLPRRFLISRWMQAGRVKILPRTVQGRYWS